MKIWYYQGTHLHGISTSSSRAEELRSLLTSCGYIIIKETSC